MCHKCEAIAASTEPRWFGRYSRTELQRACKELGVKKPVRVRAATHWGIKEFGEHWYEDGEHVITVRHDLPCTHATRTILHELTHALQVEREGPDYVVRYSLETDLFGYADNQYEREAEETADLLLPDYKIARPR